MKKKVLPLAVGAATAVAMTSAHAAMYVNERGTGESLIFPFYSAENGNNTLVNLVNTTGAHKAVKVRILEGQNSQEVLDFNLYLSPEDHFSFAISATEAGGGMLATGDNSCTVPAIPADGVPFRTLLIEDDRSDGDADGVGAYENGGVERTASGYIEVIEMGQLDPDADADVDLARGTAAASAINVATAITHDSNGMPVDCSLVVDAWTEQPAASAARGLWFDESEGADGTGDSEFNALWNGGGLYGYATVINVPQGAAFGYDAVAIADHVGAGGVAGAGADGSDMHYPPGDIFPNFADSAFDTTAIITEDGSSTEITFTAYSAAVDRLQALNATIMHDQVMNDYVTDEDIAATTDWLFTFPTKGLHIANGEEPVEPFSELWTGQSACENVAMDAVDREESVAPPPPPGTSTGPDFSPAPPPGDDPDPESNDIPLCYEATIMQFATESSMESSQLAIGVNSYLDAEDGWATVSFDPASLFDNGSELSLCGEDEDADTVGDQTDPCTRTIDGADADGDVFMTGLPVVGFAVQKYVNGAANSDGALANYAMSTEHKTTVSISR